MQKYISLFFSVLLCLTACQSNNDIPEGVIKEKEMISLLTDIHLTDGELYVIPQIPDSMYKYGSARYQKLFKRHNTTDAIYKKSLKYYTTKPQQLQDMYTKIDAIIKAKLDSTTKAARNEKPVTAPVNDSVPASRVSPSPRGKLGNRPLKNIR
ncbi:DUF4296 domain-containing protein [Mucilaginibacter terrigena]|uniref:DUF4296 domain-containing protein n=1 Tax=Mucilaginibacter terrigena TaxID=2492395 RepID=A0A4V1ZCC6_9SPHI|nr:DUF4296 domain-containing protein [Mucilaginibacter terrigena]RYU92190.1 DUF4296 domain-containing protein [Mucilaginibacter terrigena]